MAVRWQGGAVRRRMRVLAYVEMASLREPASSLRRVEMPGTEAMASRESRSCATSASTPNAARCTDSLVEVHNKWTNIVRPGVHGPPDENPEQFSVGAWKESR